MTTWRGTTSALSEASWQRGNSWIRVGRRRLQSVTASEWLAVRACPRGAESVHPASWGPGAVGNRNGAEHDGWNAQSRYGGGHRGGVIGRGRSSVIYFGHTECGHADLHNQLGCGSERDVGDGGQLVPGTSSQQYRLGVHRRCRHLHGGPHCQRLDQHVAAGGTTGIQTLKVDGSSTSVSLSFGSGSSNTVGTNGVLALNPGRRASP
jgi:hypothetical protein